jgi:hypothetical protein
VLPQSHAAGPAPLQRVVSPTVLLLLPPSRRARCASATLCWLGCSMPRAKSRRAVHIGEHLIHAGVHVHNAPRRQDDFGRDVVAYARERRVPTSTQIPCSLSSCVGRVRTKCTPPISDVSVLASGAQRRPWHCFDRGQRSSNQARAVHVLTSTVAYSILSWWGYIDYFLIILLCFLQVRHGGDI